MLIAEFAKATALSRDTIRFYVKKGLLVPEVGRSGTNRYQDFDAEQVDRALLIREGQALGFTLREIAALGEEYARGGLNRARQLQLMRERLDAIDAQAEKLARLRRYFAAKVAWLEGGGRGTAPSFAQIMGMEADTTAPACAGRLAEPVQHAPARRRSNVTPPLSAPRTVGTRRARAR